MRSLICALNLDLVRPLLQAMESLAIEFCAFTVAIAVELHPWTEVDTRKQWNPEQLSLEIGAGPCGDSVNLTVDTEALHQGLYIFKRALNNLRHEIVQMGGNKSVMSISSFMELPERRKGLNIISFGYSGLRQQPMRAFKLASTDILIA